MVVERGRTILEGTQRLLSEARAAAGEAVGVLHAFEPIGMPLIARTRCLLAMRSALPRWQFVVRQVEDPIAHLDEPCDLVLHDGPMPDRGTWFSRVVPLVAVLEGEVGAEMVFRVSTRHHSDADARTREAREHILRLLADFPEE